LNIYTKKRRWKLFLFICAVLIVTASIWYTNILVRKIAADERQNIRVWAEAVQERANLVKYTEDFFESIKVEERRKVELLAEATKRLAYAGDNEDLTLYIDIISSNETIPVISTDNELNITGAHNVDFDQTEITILEGELKEEFSVYEPVKVISYGTISYLYYKDSHTYTELKTYLDELIESFFSEVVLNSASVPVIITDSTRFNGIEYGNIDSVKISDSTYVAKTLAEMIDENEPIEIDLASQGMRYICWKDSSLLVQLRFYPLIQFGIIGLFLFIAYLVFSTARKSEQNQVWVGMSKETAHQLGTPLSSMMAWIELMKLKHLDNKIVNEIEKDVERLETITERFSKIGSTPKLAPQDIVGLIYRVTEYLKNRTSKKISYQISPSKTKEILVPLNFHLFEWVIENLFKNAIDAMGGSGTITVEITEETKKVFVDVTDTGKGIPRSHQKEVFNPGVTSKKRGWGLGLSLSKRIIENYHKGKIFVKSSVIDQGTVFRIILKK